MSDDTYRPILPFKNTDLLHTNEVEKLRADVEAMSSRIRQYEAEVRMLKRELFGPKSKRRGLLTPDQQALADIVGPMPANPALVEETTLSSVPVNSESTSAGPSPQVPQRQ